MTPSQQTQPAPQDGRTTPPGAIGTSSERSGLRREITVLNWKSYEKNTLVGFLSLLLPSGVQLNNCTLHRKGSSQWIGLAGLPYVKADGTTTYTPLIEFSSKEHRAKFQELASAAVDRFFAVARDE